MTSTKAVALLGGVSFERGLSTDELPEYLKDPHSVLWLDITAPGEAERALLFEHFGFHPLSLDDVVRGHQRPKLDQYKEHLFAVAYGLLPGPLRADESSMVEVGLFIGKNYLVTVHAHALPALDDAYQRWQKGGPLLGEGVGFALYTLLDALINSYGPVVDRLGDTLSQVELGMFNGPAERRVEQLLELRREVFQLRRLLYPTRDALRPLARSRHPLVSPALRVYFEDVYDHILRVLDLLDVHREMVAGSLDACLTIVSNRLNVTMKRLTVVSAVIGFAGCVFSAWGMNVSGVVMGSHPHGFAWVLGATTFLSLATLLVSWRRGWL